MKYCQHNCAEEGYVPSINISHDFIRLFCISLTHDIPDIIFHPVNEMVFECTLDNLMKKVGRE